MRIQLPIPIYMNNEVFCEYIDIRKPNTGCIADTKKMSDSGDMYGAIAFFVAQCIESIEPVNGEAITDRDRIKSLVRNMPYRSAEYAFTQIMLLRHPEDGVEGVYFCPRCKTRIICEAKRDATTGEILSDTRDFIRDFKVTFASGLANVQHTFATPVEIKTTDGKVLVSVDSFVMRHPTMADAISGTRRADRSDELRSQFGIYVESLVEVSGEVVDNKWRNTYGMMVFDRTDPDTDIVEISRKVNEYGMDKRKLRTCPDCEKQWRSIVNTSNFFDLEAPLM